MSATAIPITRAPTARGGVSAAERKVRVELAAAYRAVHLWGWSALIFNHITARVPGDEEHFLINNYGLMYDEVRASNLVKVDLAGNIVEGPPDAHVNLAGYVIHSAVHAARQDVACVAHTHTPAGVGVSAMEEGLLPLSLESTLLARRVGYHDFEGITVNEQEKPRLVANLGDKIGLILRNHGLLTVGRSVGEAMTRLWTLERACQMQVAALSSGKVRRVGAEVQERILAQMAKFDARAEDGERPFAAIMRQLDRTDPSYRS
jgi:ribulose-5-phosphate 4-epimerase/fuculose-1-phosphate aldolase